MRLRRPGFDCQIKSELDQNTGKEILVYREDPLQKTNQGGLANKPSNKIVRVYPAMNVKCCPVRIFGKYIGLLPTSKSCGKLYLRPRQKFTPSVWFCDAPYGKNKVSSNVKDICKLAEIPGKFSNHSLRATSATRMFAKEVPEQVIKEITGHKSECVRVYKRTSSEILQRASNSIADENVSESSKGKVSSETTKQKTDEPSKLNRKVGMSEEMKKRNCESLSACQMIKNVIKSRIEMRKKNLKGCISRWARKVLKSDKRKIAKKGTKLHKRRNLVIDLNINVNYNK